MFLSCCADASVQRVWRGPAGTQNTKSVQVGYFFLLILFHQETCGKIYGKPKYKPASFVLRGRFRGFSVYADHREQSIASQFKNALFKTPVNEVAAFLPRPMIQVIAL